MKIVVIGGSGLVGTQLVARLRAAGRAVFAASPASGVNAVTGDGLAEALDGTQVVVDVANSPSFEDKVVLSFFEASSRNLLAAERAAGVQHHLALSVVGADRLPASGYLRAKLAQENLIKASGIPYTIVRSTQFLSSPAASSSPARRTGSFASLPLSCRRSPRRTPRLPWQTSRWDRRSTLPSKLPARKPSLSISSRAKS